MTKPRLAHLLPIALLAAMVGLASGSAYAEPTYTGPCLLDATTVTCTGTQAAGGVEIGDTGVLKLDVNTVTTGIEPEIGVSGIVFDTSSAATLDIQLSTYAISVAGDGADGIYISTWGPDRAADLTLHGDVNSLGGRGVFINASGAVTSNTTGGIESLDDALTAKSWGAGVEVDHDGNLTSLAGTGLYVAGLGSDITVTGAIDSLGDAVYSHSWGEGKTEIVITGAVTSREGSGLVVDESNSTVDTVNHGDTANVNVDGAIDVLSDGISVSAMDAVTITHKGTIDAHTGFGIYGYSSYGGVTITQSNGALEAGTDGIVASARGDGADISITSSGITAYGGRGIVASTVAGSVTVGADGVTAKGDAIDAEAYGTAGVGVDIDSNEDVISWEGRGIYTYVAGGLSGITVGAKTFGIRIDQDGDITSKGDALTAVTINSNVYANVDGDVTSYDGKGIYAKTYSGEVDIDAGDVTSKLDAIYAKSSGALTINTDKVTSYDGAGVYAEATGGSSQVAVTVGDVTSKLDAIEVHSASTATVNADNVESYDGAGVQATSVGGQTYVYVDNVTSKLDAIDATATGGVTVSAKDVVSYDGLGVYANTVGGTATVNVGKVTSEGNAIYAVAPNSVSVTASDIVSYSGNGVYGTNVGGTTTYTLGNVTSKLDAVYAYGYSTVSVNAGNVISKEGYGLAASSKWSSASITAGDVTSETDAVFAQGGSGSATVSVGEVISRNGYGIYATGTAGSASSSSKGVTSLGDAVTVVSDVSSASVTATGNILSHEGKGVVASGGKGNASVQVKDVTSDLDAIYAEAKGGSSTATVVANNVKSNDGKGVVAIAENANVSVTTDDVTSKLDAVYAQAKGAGSATVITKNVTSYEGKGVTATSEKTTVSVTTGDVTSKLGAIYAVSSGSTVTVSSGDVVSYEDKGIYATTPTGFVDVSVKGVISDLDAITAVTSDGSSAYAKVTATRSVTSYSAKAIYATAHNGAVTIKVDSDNASIASDVTAALNAITASADNGAVSVTVAGNVVSYDAKAIDASSKNGAVTVTVGDDSPARTSDVTAKLDAIKAVAANGATTISVTGDVTSYDGKAVYATSDTAAVNVTINGDITGKLDAIYAETKSGIASDLTKVDVGGAVTSYGGKAIQVFSATGGIDIDVDGAVISQYDAITAKTTGNGGDAIITVTTAGVTSYSGRAIDVEATDQSVTISNTGALSAELTGIYARSTGSGVEAAVNVTQTGALRSWKGTGIDALSTGGMVTILTSGGIESDLDAVVAESQGGDDVGQVSVTNTSGKIISHKGSGIIATAARDGVTVTNTGDIEADVDGISAVSTGDTDTSGVTIAQTGDITVAKGNGIYAESVADTHVAVDGDITGGTYSINATSLRGAVEAKVEPGATLSGSSAAGVYLNGYTTAKLINHGNLSSAWGPAFVIEGDGTGTVTNYGTISGDFAFSGTAAGTFNNKQGATYNAGVMNFAIAGTFNNDGLLSLSTDESDSALENTYLNGDYYQRSTGTLRTDIRFTDNWSDRLVVSGEATLAGNVSVNVNGDLFSRVIRDFKILTAADGLELDDVSLSNPLLRGSIVEENGTDAILKITGVDFRPDDFDSTYASLTDYLQNIFVDGVPNKLKPLMAELISTPDLETYEKALMQLSPEEYGQDLQNTYAGSLGFTNRLLSCRVADGPNRFKAEGDCNWFGARASQVQQDASDGLSAYNATYTSFEAGAQRRLDANWRFGAALGITSASTSAADDSSATATQIQVGGVVKYDAGNWLLASALSGGYGVHRTERNVTVGSVDETLTGDAPVGYASLRLHSAYTFEKGATYIKPLINVDLSAIYYGGVRETGGSAALTVDPITQYAVSFNPAIEFGGEYKDGAGDLIRPFLQLGLEASLLSDAPMTARLNGVDSSFGEFSFSQPKSEPAARITLGVDVLTPGKSTLRAYYDGRFSASSRTNGVGLKWSHAF